jgi:vacuolar-type H+-ATPase subunit H
MTSPIDSHNPPAAPPLLLEAIRRKEAEVKRRLAAEHESALTASAEAERQARDLIAASEAEGRRQGEVQRQAAQAEAECEATAIVARARAEAEALQRAGETRMGAAIARAVKFIVDG